MNPKALFNLTYGIFLLTTREEGWDYGCIINAAIHAETGAILSKDIDRED